MQRSGDRQKMLASHGALLSDERLSLVVLDMRKLKTLEGRVLAHGEEELGKGPAGTTFCWKARMRRYTSSTTRQRWRKRGVEENSARILSFGCRGSLRTGGQPWEIEDSGDAQHVLSNKRRLGERAGAFRVHGIVPPEDGWGGLAGSLLSRSEKDSVGFASRSMLAS
jgi:hypothetical protein